MYTHTDTYTGPAALCRRARRAGPGVHAPEGLPGMFSLSLSIYIYIYTLLILL